MNSAADTEPKWQEVASRIRKRINKYSSTILIKSEKLKVTKTIL
jgi:hypothetical protein